MPTYDSTTVKIADRPIEVFHVSPEQVAQLEAAKLKQESKYIQVLSELDHLVVGAGILVRRADVSVDGLRAAFRKYLKNKRFITHLDEAYMTIVREK